MAHVARPEFSSFLALRSRFPSSLLESQSRSQPSESSESSLASFRRPPAAVEPPSPAQAPADDHTSAQSAPRASECIAVDEDEASWSRRADKR